MAFTQSPSLSNKLLLISTVMVLVIAIVIVIVKAIAIAIMVYRVPVGEVGSRAIRPNPLVDRVWVC